MSRGIPVFLAVNDERGNHSGKVTAIEVHDCDFLSLVCDGGMDGPVCRVVETRRDGRTFSRLKVSRRLFLLMDYQTWVGNIVWDCAWMSDWHVAGLVNYLRELPGWDCEVAYVPLMERWEKGGLFNAFDFENADAPG